MIDIFKLIEVEADGKVAHIPTFRTDLISEADLAEEIARFYGYDNIETTLAAGTPTVGKKSFEQNVEDKIITLSTCTGNESTRYVVQGKRVDTIDVKKDTEN